MGIIAAQSIGEPGTQLTMRTFHVGGTASQTFKQPIIKAKNEGIVRFNDLKVVEGTEHTFVVLNKNGTVSVHAKDGRELESYNIVIGSVISIADGNSVKKGETFIQWDPYNVPIITEKAGKIEFRDMIQGVTIRKEVDEATGVMGTVVIEHKEDLHPQIVIVGEKREIFASYSIPAGAHIEVKEGQKVPAGTRLARTPRKIAKTKDITGGLPRVAELFEARRPKDAAEIAKIDGTVDIGGTVRGKRRLIVTDADTGAEEEHLIPLSKHIIVFKGDFVKKGQQLTEGPVVPHEVLDVCGPQELQEHLLNEVQEVYRLQGVEINDKHIEIIVRQMLRKVKITDPGDTSLLWGDQVDRLDFSAENERVIDKGGNLPMRVPFCWESRRLRWKPTVSSQPRRFRTRHACSRRRQLWARSTGCGDSKRTSSWAISSPRGPVLRATGRLRSCKSAMHCRLNPNRTKLRADHVIAKSRNYD